MKGRVIYVNNDLNNSNLNKLSTQDNNSTPNNKGKNNNIEFIFLIISLILIIIFKNFVGSIFAIITLIFSIKNIKGKKLLTIISLIGAILLIIYSIIAFTISANVISNLIKEAKENLQLKDNNFEQEKLEEDEYCLDDLCYKLYDGYFINEKGKDFVTIKYEDENTYCYYSIDVRKNQHKNSKEYFRSLSWLDEYDISEKQIDNLDFSYISYYESDDMRTDLLATVYNNKLYQIGIFMGAKDIDYKNCLSAYNYMLDNFYVK